jgi:hypothetical protein
MSKLAAALAMLGLFTPQSASAENSIYLQCLINQDDWQGHPSSANRYVYYMIDLDKKRVAEYNDISQKYVDFCGIDSDLFKCDINDAYFEAKEFYKDEVMREIHIYRNSGKIIDTHYVDGRELAQSRGTCS